MPTETDRFVVTVTDDQAFRVITLRTTDTAQAAVRAQSVGGRTAQRLGELLTGAAIVRVTMAPQLRVQGLMRGASGSGQLVADSHPEGWCRGLAQLGEGSSDVEIGGSAILQMMRSLPSGELHQGIVEVPEEGGISASLTAYMAHSEQVVSTVGVSCTVDGDHVSSAGGYIVQLLPEVPRDRLAVMTERLDHDFATLAPILDTNDASPVHLADELLYAMPSQRVDEQPLRFDCHCSDVRVMGALSTLSRDEIESMIAEGEHLDMTCEYCGKQYVIEPERLRGLLETS